ncbi:hypothetical protein M885DRAFT_550432, partial [Pelagophyceae sp. CCMP2097]
MPRRAPHPSMPRPDEAFDAAESDEVVQQLSLATPCLVVFSNVAFLWSVVCGFRLLAVAAHACGTLCWAGVMIQAEAADYVFWFRVVEIANAAIATAGFLALAAQGAPAYAALYLACSTLYVAVVVFARRLLSRLKLSHRGDDNRVAAI